MITTAITGAIAGVLAMMGIPPGPYIAGVWVAIKILMVFGVGAVLTRSLNRNKPTENIAEPSN